MADDDEIDILGDFSFNSCFAQNSQGIPSCSSREDTVHPQWLLDSTANNWYDIQTSRNRKLTGNNTRGKHNNEMLTTWSPAEKDLLAKEVAKFGRNVRKISQTLKTKTEAEIQALIEAEYGVNLETPLFGLDKNEDHENVPTVVQEEIVADEVSSVLEMVTTGTTTIPVTRKKPYNKKNNTKNLVQQLNSEPNPLLDNKNIGLQAINPAEILYEDDLVVGSIESVGSDLDSAEMLSRNMMINQQKEKMKVARKAGNHRRKLSRNSDKGSMRKRSEENLKSPQGRQRVDSGTSEDIKSPKMQIVFSSGQALSVSEGEQVIKLEKDAEPESDIEVDVDSDNEQYEKKEKPAPSTKSSSVEETPIAMPLRKFEPMPKRQKRIHLPGDGAGGYTIMHTAAGDLYAVGDEPRPARPPRPRAPRPRPLLQCRLYNAELPAPYEVRIAVSALIAMDAHAHTSRGEVMGLAGGQYAPPSDPPVAEGSAGSAETPARLTVTHYRRARAAAGGTHCDMDPVSQSAAAEYLASLGAVACAWHHSHPTFGAAPSDRDLRSQRALQRGLERPSCPLLAVITSQHWPRGRTASQYRCFRVEESLEPTPDDIPIGYQFSVRLQPDLTMESLPGFLRELRGVMTPVEEPNEYTVDLVNDVCPEAGLSYLDKCISSVSHHMRSAGYGDQDPITERLLLGIRDIFR